MNVDVLVVGAGLAGLQTATLLANEGHDVLLVERRSSLGDSIRTTGIFVHKTLDDFDLPPECLGPPIRRVMLYGPGMRSPVELISDRDEFRVGDMGPLYIACARDAVDAGVQVMTGTRYLGRVAGSVLLEGPDGLLRVTTRYLVGADGARSAVARDLGLDRNKHLLVGAEEVFEVPNLGQEPTFHCVLDPDLAPGYLAWVVDDGEHAHVGTAGYADRYRDGLRGTLERFSAAAPGLEHVTRPARIERRAGAIPVGGLLKRISNRDGLLVGDAAGAVSPLTAGGLDPCMRQAVQAAEVLDEALRTGRPDVLARYDGAVLRARFRGRLTLRRMLAGVRSPLLASLAFHGIRTPMGKAAARGILFGDRSFPDAPVPPERAAVWTTRSR